MFQRRKRNLDLSGLNEHFQKENRSTYGIDWGTHRNLSPDDQIGKNLPSEEIIEDDSFPIWVPRDQPELTRLENDQPKFTDTRKAKKYSPPLTKRPSFSDQQQKVTIYLDKELVRQMEHLKKERYIPSYSWLISESIQHYLGHLK
ncbi:CopG family transcriptional regulator [uncultured Brevibacillus sp.]|uniref:ribbon-helix-helix domain-containing protein n=1 Tax=uncultured Brevibacillus sp. TaxID=169970 RepID=UPI00259A06E3|nr:CopG family transcriptional regulator [uncultured Brevibacillus sp.]